MGAEASRLDGDKATFRYGEHALVLWASERVDALFEEDGQFYEAEIQGKPCWHALAVPTAGGAG